MRDDPEKKNTDASPCIRVVFFDVDGTLLSTEENRVPRSTRRALKELRKRGIKTVVATARHIHRLEEMPVQNIEFDNYITLNGQIICDADHKMYAGTPIDRGEMEILAHMFDAKKIPFVMVNEHGDYINYVNETVIETQAKFNDKVPEVGEYGGEDVFQIMAFATEKEKEMLDEFLDECSITSWSDTGIDIVPRLGGKISGIQLYLDNNGIDRSEAMAFGDGENDIPMMKEAGISIAMSIAGERVKAAADYVTL